MVFGNERCFAYYLFLTVIVESCEVWCVLKVAFLFYVLCHHDTVFNCASLEVGTHPSLMSVITFLVQLDHHLRQTLSLNPSLHDILHHLDGFGWPRRHAELQQSSFLLHLWELMDENKQPADVSWYKRLGCMYILGGWRDAILGLLMQSSLCCPRP